MGRNGIGMATIIEISDELKEMLRHVSGAIDALGRFSLSDVPEFSDDSRYGFGREIEWITEKLGRTRNRIREVAEKKHRRPPLPVFHHNPHARENINGSGWIVRGSTRFKKDLRSEANRWRNLTPNVEIVKNPVIAAGWLLLVAEDRKEE
jgi:hypothetical protein